jgi:hypothetical protein
MRRRREVSLGLVSLMLGGAGACRSPGALEPQGPGIQQDRPRTLVPPPGETPVVNGVSPPVATPSPRPLAVLVDRGADGPGADTPEVPGTYTVSLMDSSGTVVARVAATEPTPIRLTGAIAIPLPCVSVSLSRLYYLDGDTSVRVLVPYGGATGEVTTVPGGARAHVAIAVSPDDRRIAVGVLDYGTEPASARLYAEDLRGGNRMELFASDRRYVWPVAWLQDAIVLATADSPGIQQVPLNPYAAITGYQVVDAASGEVRAEVCPHGRPLGPAVGAGTVCLVQDEPGAVLAAGWSAQVRPFLEPGRVAVGALSPDGTTIAAAPWEARAQRRNSRVVLLRSGGSQEEAPAAGWPRGWIDDTHLVLADVFGDRAPLSVLDVAAGTLTPVEATGAFAGTLPPTLARAG